MKRVKLTKGYFAKVDDSDYKWLNQYHWTTLANKNETMYAVRSSMGKSIRMHRLILGLTDTNIHCDHKDGDGLNNQRSNLRKCTRMQNSWNQRSHRNSSSKYVGVYKHTTSFKDGTQYQYWRAQIIYNKKLRLLGYFKDERRAAIERDKSAIIYHGEFANLNILKIRN